MNIKNSCDGCCADMPIENGLHVNTKAVTSWNKYHMACTAHLYGYGKRFIANKLPVFKLFNRKS